MNARPGWRSRWLAPAALVLVLALGWPMLQTLHLALGSPSGLGRLFSDRRFAHSLGFTLSFAALSVTLEIILGLVLALALAKPLPLSWLWRSSLLLPWALPSVVSSRLFSWLFHYQLGLVNLLLIRVGISHPPDWFANSWSAWTALICLDLWKTLPLVALMLLAGRQQIPESLHEAAALDGASPWEAFRHVTLPLLRPMLVVALLFRMVDALRIFDSIWALTGGGPGYATESVSIYAYSLYFRDYDQAYGAWVSLGLLACVMAGAWLLVRAGQFEKDLKAAA